MSNESEKNTSGMGNTMTILAWVAGLALIALIFDDVLLSQINPNRSPESRFEGGQATVVLKRNRYGHYVTTGRINGQEVVFLVDTGATNVAVPVAVAQRLGLNQGVAGRSMTANGTVTTYRTNIPELEIGKLRLTDISGSINPGMEGEKILLGMSVLKQLEFTQRGDTLILKSL